VSATKTVTVAVTTGDGHAEALATQAATVDAAATSHVAKVPRWPEV
jgi:hypothetical protein